MPTGYEVLPQLPEEEQDDSRHNHAGKSRRGRAIRRSQKPGHIDLSKLDNAFKRWTEFISQKIKRQKKSSGDYSRKEIWQSVFDPYLPAFSEVTPPPPRQRVIILTQSVRNAISAGIHPKMIAKGSSGSYFARAKVDGKVQTTAVFKPKDEEPYGRLNPKTTKWLHRQFRWLIPFGRSCLIPNLSYISEAAASLLDERLALNIVPRTQLVSLSSPAFFYDWLDRSAAKKGKPLPEKIGSMQLFLHGYTDASEFLRKHPWPGRSIADTFDDSSHRKGIPTKKCLSALKIICGKTGDDENDDVDSEEEHMLFDAGEDDDTYRTFHWSRTLQQDLRDELEKCAVSSTPRIMNQPLTPDYLMLNTDRGADNWMIKYCEGDHDKSPVAIAPQASTNPRMPLMSELRSSGFQSSAQAPVAAGATPLPRAPSIPSDYTRYSHIHVAAIDNSLSFPHEHPQGWRSYTYGWLYLPVSLIGRPFSEKTRSHFLPLLTSKAWWEETTFQLRRLFAVDPDFHPKMFRRQLAVIKGQAYNIVESLKHPISNPLQGPLELTRRTRALVWDDEVEMPEEALRPPNLGPLSSPRPSINTVPLPQRVRSRSHSSEFSPRVRRRSSEANRPVPFSAKFQKVHPGTTGVTVLEHLERLDVVEAGLQKLGVGEPLMEEEEEVDVGELSVSHRPTLSIRTEASSRIPQDMSVAQQFTPPGKEDLAIMSRSTSHVEPPFSVHTRWNSHAALDWMNFDDSEQPKRTFQRLEYVQAKPLVELLVTHISCRGT
ncbi:phosphatidylinositol 3 and 4-kinase-domain-containing protein [Pisolithus microcarpus]|nr:phosphatidylinositol 3 and 4-kinase-domain-containing protein [Pisolithus microcarpus]